MLLLQVTMKVLNTIIQLLVTYLRTGGFRKGKSVTLKQRSRRSKQTPKLEPFVVFLYEAESLKMTKSISYIQVRCLPGPLSSQKTSPNDIPNGESYRNTITMEVDIKHVIV